MSGDDFVFLHKKQRDCIFTIQSLLVYVDMMRCCPRRCGNGTTRRSFPTVMAYVFRNHANGTGNPSLRTHLKRGAGFFASECRGVTRSGTPFANAHTTVFIFVSARRRPFSARNRRRPARSLPARVAGQRATRGIPQGWFQCECPHPSYW